MNRTRSTLTRRLIAASFALILTRGAAAADSRAQEFDIASQPLSAALAEFARQSDRQILFSTAVAASKTTAGVKGNIEAEAALRELLNGTDLTYSITSDGAILVESARVRETSWVPNPEFRRVAHVDTGDVTRTDDAAPSAGIEGAALAEVLVTGSRLGVALSDSPLPVRVHDQQAMRSSGQTTVAGFVNTLPEVSIPAMEGALGTNNYLDSPLRLYGLPAGMTLTLLNGRRMQPSQSNAVNLTNIPQAMVERIEILPVGGSAIYGSDALGGGLNIILKPRTSGVSADIQYGHAKGYEETDASLAMGFDGGRGGGALVFNYHSNAALMGYERSRFRTAEVPEYFFPYLLGDHYCAPGTIYSLDGQGLGIPGSDASSAAIPSNIQGRPSAADFGSTAGQVRRCNAHAGTGLIPASERYGAMLMADYDVSPGVRVFTELLASSNDQDNTQTSPIVASNGAAGDVVIPADNPFNPFGKAVGLSATYDVADGGHQQETDFYRALIGLQAEAGGWSYEATASISRDETKTHQNSSLAASVLQEALDEADPARAFNPFNSRNPASDDVIDGLLAAAMKYQLRYMNELTSVQAFARAPTISLPGGELRTVIGAEYSKERESYGTTDFYTGASPEIERQLVGRESSAAFAEIFLPIARNAEGVTNLSMTAAGRYDRAEDFGGEFTWQGGFVWKPASMMALRANYSTAYRAPVVERMHRPRLSFGSLIRDDLRGGELYSATFVTGGNPDLKEETGISKTVGVSFDPFRNGAFIADLNWFGIEIDNFIQFPSYYLAINDPDLMPSVVVRDAQTPEDIALGYPGAVRLVDTRPLNFGTLEVAGISGDLRARIETSVGEFAATASATYMTKWTSAVVPGAEVQDFVGQATFSGPGFAPRVRAAAGLGFNRTPLAFNVSGQYVGRYHDFQELTPNDHVLGDYWLVNASLSVELQKLLSAAASAFQQTALTFGVSNLMDRDPDFAAGPEGFDPFADRRGRFVFARLSVGF